MAGLVQDTTVSRGQAGGLPGLATPQDDARIPLTYTIQAIRRL